jgi:hypothetical protein
MDVFPVVFNAKLALFGSNISFSKCIPKVIYCAQEYEGISFHW